MTEASFLTAMVTKDGDIYVAQCADVDVASQCATFEEAIANLREALELRWALDTVVRMTY